MLTRLFTFHQVMPAYLDFISVFGRQEEPRDLHFGGFREAMAITKTFDTPGLPSRSDRQYQLCFNLKGVTLKENTSKRERKMEDSQGSNDRTDTDSDLAEMEYEWSIRQAAFYHQFDVATGTTLWIVTKGGLDIQQRFKDLTVKQASPESNSFDTRPECFHSSLAALLMYCQWSTEDWRGYLRWLENVVDQKVRLYRESFSRQS